MRLFRIAWLGFIRRGGGLIVSTAPTVVLFMLITLLVALETTTYNYTQADKAIDSRMIRVGAVVDPFSGTNRSTLERLPHVVGSSPVIALSCKTVSTTPVPIPCHSMSPDMIPFYYRQYYVPKDAAEEWAKHKDGIIVGGDIAEAQHWTQGQRITLNVNGENKELPITYIANRGEKIDAIWMHIDWADSLKPATATGRYRALWLVVDAAENRQGVIDAVEKELASLPNPPDIQTAEMAKAQLLGFSALLIAVLRAAGILAVVIVVLTTVISLILSTERRRQEMAALRAIGCQRSDLAVIIISEAVLLGLPGVLFGSLITFLYSMSQGRIRLSRFLMLRVSPTDALIAFGFGMLLYIVLAALPARRAANANVLAALRGD